MKIGGNRKPPVPSHFGDRIGKKGWRSVRRVAVTAYVDEQCGRPVSTVRERGLKQLSLGAVDCRIWQTAFLIRIQHNKCSFDLKCTSQFLGEQDRLIADPASSRLELSKYLDQQWVGLGHRISLRTIYISIDIKRLSFRAASEFQLPASCRSHPPCRTWPSSPDKPQPLKDRPYCAVCLQAARDSDSE